MKRAPQSAIRELLDDLQRQRTRIQQMSDLLWQSIDHNDPRDLKEGTPVQQAYVTARNELDGAARNVEKVLRPLLRTGAARSRRGRTRTVTLQDDLTHTRPVSYRLLDSEHPVAAWKEVYLGVLTAIADRNEALLKQLPGRKELHLSRRGDFSTDMASLRYPLHIRHGVYAETNYTANGLRDRMRLLLEAAGLPRTALTAQVNEKPGG